MKKEEQTSQTPRNELMEEALQHYEDLMQSSSVYYSCIPNAIKQYFNDGWIKYNPKDESTWPIKSKFYDVWRNDDQHIVWWDGEVFRLSGITHYAERRTKPLEI